MDSTKIESKEAMNKPPEAIAERKEITITSEPQGLPKLETTTFATTSVITTSQTEPSISASPGLAATGNSSNNNYKRKLDEDQPSPDEPELKIVRSDADQPVIRMEVVSSNSDKNTTEEAAKNDNGEKRGASMNGVVGDSSDEPTKELIRSADPPIVEMDVVPIKKNEDAQTKDCDDKDTDTNSGESKQSASPLPNETVVKQTDSANEENDRENVATNTRTGESMPSFTSQSLLNRAVKQESDDDDDEGGNGADSINVHPNSFSSPGLQDTATKQTVEDGEEKVETIGNIDSVSSAPPGTPDIAAKQATEKDDGKVEAKSSNGSLSSTPPDTRDRAANQATNKEKVKSETNGGGNSRPPTPPSRPQRAAKQAATIALDSSVNSNSKGVEKMESEDEFVSKYITLDPVPKKTSKLAPLNAKERKELENCLEIPRDEPWRDDWIGNLCFADKDVVNPDGKKGERQKKPLFRWAERGKNGLKILNNLLRFVFHQKETPPQAKKILANADPTSVKSIQDAVRRVSYDPVVLREDGWMTAKSPEPIGASGGPYRIGEMVFWQGFEGVIIAYIHDNDLGDLWKAMWIEEFDTFDLEAEELDDAKKKYNRKKQREAAAANGKSSKKSSKSQLSSAEGSKNGDAEGARRSVRNPAADFSVTGIEHGIVLAVSYSRGARPGVFWPARVMHFSEMKSYGSQAKRGTQKQKVEVVFLAPYWNAASAVSGGRARSESYSDALSKHGSSIFSSGQLFEVESIDATEESIQQYPYTDGGLDIDQLRVSFKFAGLPKAAFSRFVDSHRLALGLRTFSKKVLKSTVISEIEMTTASLLEAHPMAAQAPSFPSAVLHLPFQHILSQLPTLDRDASTMAFDESDPNEEPALQLGNMLDSMKPPFCWGMGGNDNYEEAASPVANRRHSLLTSPPMSLNFDGDSDDSPVTVDRFISDLASLRSLLSSSENESSMSCLLGKNLNQLLKKIPHSASEFKSLSPDKKLSRAKTLVKLWIVVKTHGEELISSGNSLSAKACLLDWRKACERIYRYITIASSSTGVGNGVSQVLTDSCCNLHVTSTECFERAVRLPAALKAAKQAGAGKSDRLKLSSGVGGKYLELAENKVIRMAHSKTYLRRMKKRCLAVTNPTEVVPLTEDSEGNGGEDTKGSRGSWNAALAGVGAAVQGVDMIMNGECVNVFCLTRPPGHHAGRELHAMKAVSNGFCLLNPVACAALYATSPVSEGGPGIRRVCVIDIDVHHGNGTQDILASTYDPRFFYVSVHAGGPDVNGIDAAQVEDLEIPSHHLGRTPKKGIFPGRCGDYSPHEGVLNIPLGARVTSHALGTALVQKVSPAVEKFSPELIIVSAGFDAHRNDPLGLGGLSAEDYGTLTEVICKLAHKSCSGRVLSVLEGGYGVPCCRPMQTNLFDPEAALKKVSQAKAAGVEKSTTNEDESTAQPMEIENADKDPTSKPAKPAETQPKPAEPSQPKPEQPTHPKPVQPTQPTKPEPQQKQLPILELGDDLPEDMKDDVPYPLRRRLDKCHAEGFMDCVRDHIRTLAKCNMRS